MVQKSLKRQAFRNIKNQQRMNDSTDNDLLNLHLHFNATPALLLLKPYGQAQEVPFTDAPNGNGFALAMEARLPYNHLSKVVNTILHGKRFEITEGFMNQHIIISNCNMQGGPGGTLIVEVRFAGSFAGTAYLTGKPVYNAATQRIELANFKYDLKTNNFLLKGAKWLFNRIILEEIQKYTEFDLTPYYHRATLQLNDALKKQWANGIQLTGKVEQLAVTGVQAQPQHLSVALQVLATLQVTLSTQVLKL
jgi:hypothetical protein